MTISGHLFPISVLRVPQKKPYFGMTFKSGMQLLNMSETSAFKLSYKLLAAWSCYLLCYSSVGISVLWINVLVIQGVFISHPGWEHYRTIWTTFFWLRQFVHSAQNFVYTSGQQFSRVQGGFSPSPTWRCQGLNLRSSACKNIATEHEPHPLDLLHHWSSVKYSSQESRSLWFMPSCI